MVSEGKVWIYGETKVMDTKLENGAICFALFDIYRIFIPPKQLALGLPVDSLLVWKLW